MFLTTNTNERLFHVESKVLFSKIQIDVLEQYLATKDSLDKAGAYGIQGPGLTFVKEVKGSYSNVVGFPLAEFVNELKEMLGFCNNYKDFFS